MAAMVLRGPGVSTNPSHMPLPKIQSRVYRSAGGEVLYMARATMIFSMSRAWAIMSSFSLVGLFSAPWGFLNMAMSVGIEPQGLVDLLAHDADVGINAGCLLDGQLGILEDLQGIRSLRH